MEDRWLELVFLTIIGVGFIAVIVWVNFYAMDDDSPDPGDENYRGGPGNQSGE